MKLRFNESSIVEWADKYEYARDEDSLLKMRPVIAKAGFITKAQLAVIANWKSPRSAGHTAGNQDSFVKEVTGWSFSASDERSRIEVLTLLDGVSWPTASVILHLFHRERYPILDFRALWSVKAEVPKQYSFDFWQEYVEFCRAIARKYSIDMRTLDRALWQYSKERQVRP
jgi:hypothetical protein